MMRTTVCLAALLVGALATVACGEEAGTVELWKTLPEPSPIPKADSTGYASVNGVEIYYTLQGNGEPLILLHGGLGHTEHWGGQIAALSAKYKVINIASRGHGRSTRDDRAFSYDLMASDVMAVMDALAIEKASIVGWSDGGNIGLHMAIHNPERLVKVFTFGANYHPSGVKPTIQTDSVFGVYMAGAAADYTRLSKTPEQFDAFVAQISEMWATQPDFTPEQLKSIQVPVAVVSGEFEEAIEVEHLKQLAAYIPGSTLILMPDLGHFGVWQDPEAVSTTILDFLDPK